MKIIVTLMAALLSLSGCVTMEKAAPAMDVREIKTVAIVGYTVDVKDNDGKIFTSQFKMKWKPNEIVESPLSEKVYNGLRADLKKATGWKVLPLSRVTGNEIIKNYYAKNKSKWKSGGAIVPKNFHRFGRRGVPQTYHFADRRFNKGELAKALGVDAVVVYDVASSIVKPFGIGGIGIGKARYGASVGVDVYDSNGARVFSLNSRASNRVPKVDKKNLIKFGNDLNGLYTYEAVTRSRKSLAGKIEEQF